MRHTLAMTSLRRPLWQVALFFAQWSVSRGLAGANRWRRPVGRRSSKPWIILALFALLYGCLGAFSRCAGLIGLFAPVGSAIALPGYPNAAFGPVVPGGRLIGQSLSKSGATRAGASPSRCSLLFGGVLAAVFLGSPEGRMPDCPQYWRWWACRPGGLARQSRRPLWLAHANLAALDQLFASLSGVQCFATRRKCRSCVA